MFERKADILKWIGEHFADNNTAQTVAFEIIANILTTIEAPKNPPSYSEVTDMKYDIQKILKKYLNRWSE